MSELPFVNEDGRLMVESFVIRLEGGYILEIPAEQWHRYQFNSLGVEVKDEIDREVLNFILTLEVDFSIPADQWDAAATSLGAALAPGIIQATNMGGDTE